MDSELNCMVDKPDDGWKGEAKRFAARIQELERERDAYRNELESIRKAVGQGVSTTPLIAFVNDLKARVQYLEQQALAARQEFEDEDRDKSPIYFQPNISYYTR